MEPSPGSTESSGTFVRRVPPLPGDVIAQVCRETFDSTPDQYDLSLTRVAPNQWCAEQRFRKGLSLVSKLWWEPAIKGLYEHIVVRQVSQIAALARTLRSEDAGVNFGALVRRITLHECVVILPDYNIVGEDVRTIFERCVALEELSLQRHPDGTDVIAESSGRVYRAEACINPIWIFPHIIVPALQARDHTTLRKLDLVSFQRGHRNPNLAVALYNLISTSPRLTALAVHNLEATGPELPSLDFLQELTLYFPYFAPLPSTRDIWQWSFPKLRSLTILQYYLTATPVLEALGRNLTYLHIYNEIYCGDRNLATLPALCPALEHLVLHPQEPLLEWRPALFRESAREPFPRLRFLDVWITSQVDTKIWDADRAAALLAHARASVAPALEGVRGLLACMRGLPHSLPTICHPSVIDMEATATGAGSHRDESRLVCVRDVWVLQTAWCVRPVADWWLDRDMWLGDDSEDYVYESESDDSAEDLDSELSDALGGDADDVASDASGP